MGGHVNLRFVGWRWERDPPRDRFDQGHLREGGLDTEASSHCLEPAKELC